MDPVNPYAAPETLELGPVATAWLASSSDSLRKVAGGLAIIRSSVGLLIISVAVFIVASIVLVRAHVPRAEIWVPALFFASVIVAQLMHLYGGLQCLAAPAETRARGWIVFSVIASVISALMNLPTEFSLVGLNMPWATEIGALQPLFGIAAFVALIVFFRKLARFIARSDLARRAAVLLVVWGVALGVSAALIVIRASHPQPIRRPDGGGGLLDSQSAVLFTITLIVLGTVAVAKYLSLLADLRVAILNARQSEKSQPG